MSLSKKNLDKLNKFINKKNLIIDINNLSKHTKTPKNDNFSKNDLKSDDPNKIFYSIIENSETLEDTSEVNQILRNSEINQININSKKAYYSRELTVEDELYDEFNYLLDE